MQLTKLTDDVAVFVFGHELCHQRTGVLSWRETGRAADVGQQPNVSVKNDELSEKVVALFDFFRLILCSVCVTIFMGHLA